MLGCSAGAGSWPDPQTAEPNTRKPESKDQPAADDWIDDAHSLPARGELREPGLPALPESVYAVARVTDGRFSCSATAVCINDEGTVFTCARHCFGTKARDGITVKAWYSDSENAGRDTVTVKGFYKPGPQPADSATITVSGWQARFVSTVGIGVSNSLRGRNVVAVGCPRAVWPPQAFRGVITTADASTIWSTCSIDHGQSGGALFDIDTGFLIGITNWGNGQPGSLRSCGALSLELTNKLLDAHLPKINLE